MSTRRIKKSYRNVTGVLASKKNDRLVQSESTLERDLYNLLEFDPLVFSYEEQPVTLPYQIPGGKASRYTPDVVIHLNQTPDFIWKYSPFRAFYKRSGDSPVSSNEKTEKSFLLEPKISGIVPKAILVEVKYRNELFKLWRELKPKFKATRQFAAERNWQFRIITEQEIRTRLLLNVKFIRSFERHEFSVAEIMRVVDKLAELEGCRMSELLEAISDDQNTQRRFIPVIWQLVCRHEIDVDWNQPLTMHSTLLSLG